MRVPAPPGLSCPDILAEGTVLQGYTLSYLASGGMSVVYKGTLKGRSYVLKEVPSGDPQLIVALTQEKAVLERLRHPGIVTVEDLFEADGYYYLVLEYIEGQNLEALAERSPSLPESQVRQWGQELCDILGYLHAQDPPVIYRDLKTSNLMLDSQGRLRLLDFGIARVHKSQRSRDTEPLGSFQSASPEHYGEAQTDQRSDVYTLGATLYELMAGPNRPNLMPVAWPPLRQVRPDASADLERILTKAMAARPEERFQTMAQMRGALGPRKSRRPLWALLACTLLPLLVGMVWSRMVASPTPAGEEEDTGLPGSVFGVREQPDGWVVTLGEDVGLFLVTEGKPQAEVVAAKLNKLYHTRCPVCGEMKLEPAGFRLGRCQDQVVVFYSHVDGTKWHDPMVLASMTASQARRIQAASPKLGAGYWRDLTRDLVELSRGREGINSPLGPELRQELLAARRHLPNGTQGAAALRAVLDELPNQKVVQLTTLFEHVPAGYHCKGDVYPPVEGRIYPLKG